jgi:hypothetical protein
MRWLRVVLVLLGGTAAAGAAESAGPSLPSGTLLFLENCSSVVEHATKGKIGHVAVLMADGGSRWIYEATPAQVRRITQEEYFAELARINLGRGQDDRIRVWVKQPSPEFTAAQVEAMRGQLNQQLGKPYSVRDYVRETPSDGVHCAELASTTLNASGRFAFKECHRLHPSALYSAVDSGYGPALEIAIPDPAIQASWCIRAQRQTASWWKWCGWSCQEAWRFCW